MTSPITDQILPKSYVLKGAGASTYATVSAGLGRTSNTIKLPTGENIIRVSAPGYTGQLRFLGFRDGVTAIFKEWSVVPSSGTIVLPIPNADPNAWVGVQTSTADPITIGLTIHPNPPATT